MTSRCREVLRPQFRGPADWSRGCGDDRAKCMIGHKIAEPGHIAMFGSSYSGDPAFAAFVRPTWLFKLEYPLRLIDDYLGKGRCGGDF